MTDSTLTLEDRDPSNRGSWITVLKILAWAGVILVGLRFWLKDAVPYFELSEAAYGRFWSRWGWLLVHIIGGTVALLMGPFQFWTGLRRKHLRIHRWTGRLYMAGVMLGSSAAFYLSFQTEIGWTFGVALFVLGGVWVTVTGMALLAVLRRKINAHKEWIIRSYVVTFAFVTFRIFFDMESIQALGSTAEVATTIGWLCWSIPLFATEVILQTRKDGLLRVR